MAAQRLKDHPANAFSPARRSRTSCARCRPG